MKELSIEEKAKCYDEALRVLHKYDGANIMFSQSLKEEMFPELKESEDERIRKDIITHFKAQQERLSTTSNAFTSYPSWIAWLKKQGEKTEPIEGFNTEFERQISHIIASTINKEYEYTEDSVKWVSNALLNYAKHEFEKQGEQKHDDKVEPKFNADDWIIKNDDSSINIDYSCCKITKVENGNYTIESVYGYKGYNTFETFEKDYHIWSTQDAKDGDVLATKVGGIFIYKELLYDKPFAYCGVDKFGVFKDCNCGDGLDWTPYLSDVTPATKERRDLLFQKMKEAGYEWDVEKKELKKIEQNPAWSGEDEEMYKEVLTNIIYAKNDLKAKECHGLSKRTMEAFNWFSNGYKSLRPQNNTTDEELAQPQNTWKPSDEQMTYIQDAISKYNKFSNEYMGLVKLYNDLKKLREV